MKYIFLSYLLFFAAQACDTPSSAGGADNTTVATTTEAAQRDGTQTLVEAGLDKKYADYAKAYFASGCFWCTEAVFERVAGVVDVLSGYTAGPEARPTYKQVSMGATGHAEAVVVYYDSEVVTYEQLVEFFFASHDPTQVDRQGPDVGKQYRSGIYFLNPEQEAIAMAYKDKLDKAGKYSRPIATEIQAANDFYVAEDYHQNYYELHPNQSYVYNVSRPKVEKFVKEYQAFLKEAYRP